MKEGKGGKLEASFFVSFLFLVITDCRNGAPEQTRETKDGDGDAVAGGNGGFLCVVFGNTEMAS